MTVIFKRFQLKTKPYCDVINITQQVQSAIDESGVKNGIVNVHNAGSTGGVSTAEYEQGIVNNDIEEFLEKIVPYDKNYKHHRTWGDHNGAGHLRSFLIKTSQTFPFRDNRLLLGHWEQIIFCEFDEKARTRELTVTIIGE